MKETAGDLDVQSTLDALREEMQEASSKLEFEKAALLRDQIRQLSQVGGNTDGSKRTPSPTKGRLRVSKTTKKTRGGRKPRRTAIKKHQRS